jgi:hypothetical protein
MATLRNREELFEKIRRTGNIFWQIWEGEKTMLGEYRNQDANSMDESINQLQEELDSFEPGYFIAKLFEYPTGKRKDGGGFLKNMEFRFNSKSSNEVAGVGSTDKATVSALQKVTKERDELIEEKRQNELDARFEKLEKLITGNREVKEEASPADKFLDRLERMGMIGPLAKKFFDVDLQPVTSPALGDNVAGTQSEATKVIAEQLEKCKAACIRLMAIDSKVGDRLLKMADMAEKEPTKYQTAVSFL